MRRSARFSVSVRPDDLAEIDRRRGGTPRSRYLVARALREPGSLEDAVETVVEYLASIHREELAAAVAIATDPTSEKTRRGLLAELRKRLRKRQ